MLLSETSQIDLPLKGLSRCSLLLRFEPAYFHCNPMGSSGVVPFFLHQVNNQFNVTTAYGSDLYCGSLLTINYNNEMLVYTNFLFALVKRFAISMTHVILLYYSYLIYGIVTFHNIMNMTKY